MTGAFSMYGDLLEIRKVFNESVLQNREADSNEQKHQTIPVLLLALETTTHLKGLRYAHFSKLFLLSFHKWSTGLLDRRIFKKYINIIKDFCRAKSDSINIF